MNGVKSLSILISQALYLNYLDNPNPDDFGESLGSFLHYLQKATAILLTGQDSSKTRAVCTLLHGNEPSGIQAVFDYLKAKKKPRFDTLFIIGSVQAASTNPFFLSGCWPVNVI
jgi:hypothetical protein